MHEDGEKRNREEEAHCDSFVSRKNVSEDEVVMGVVK